MKSLPSPQHKRSMPKLIDGLINSSKPSDVLSWDYDVWTDGLSHANNATADRGELHAIYANGAGTSGTLNKDAILAVDGSINGVMKAVDGGVITNFGELNALRTSTGQSGDWHAGKRRDGNQQRDDQLRAVYR